MFAMNKVAYGKEPRRLEGYISFMSPSPFVMMPDTTAAIWWLRSVKDTTWGNPDFAQRLNLDELKYRKESPPGYEKVKQ
jgi:hypothetical protein